MYFTTKLEIDLTGAKKIEPVKPKSFFKKLLGNLSSGSNSTMEDHETFCAITILQQFASIFKLLQIDNIIRLAKDNTDFYFDKEGKEDDVSNAFEQFNELHKNKDRVLFKHLYLVLEHKEGSFDYLVEIQINRIHKVGEYPITVIINGIFNQFEIKNNQLYEVVALKEKMQTVFKDQATYDALIQGLEQEFIDFTTKISKSIEQHIGVNEVKLDFHQNIVRPRQAVERPEEIYFYRSADLEPIFHGYYGFDKEIYYAWHWAILCAENNIEVRNVYLVNERGGLLYDCTHKILAPQYRHLLEPGIDFDTMVTAAEEEGEDEKSPKALFSFSKIMMTDNKYLEMGEAPDQYSFENPKDQSQ